MYACVSLKWFISLQRKLPAFSDTHVHTYTHTVFYIVFHNVHFLWHVGSVHKSVLQTISYCSCGVFAGLEWPCFHLNETHRAVCVKQLRGATSCPTRKVEASSHTHIYTHIESLATMQSTYSNISNTHCGNHYWILPYLILLWKIRTRLFVTLWSFSQRGSFTHKTLTAAQAGKRGATSSTDGSIKCHIHIVAINHVFLQSSRWSCELNHTVRSLVTVHTNATHQHIIWQATPRRIWITCHRLSSMSENIAK